MFSGSSDIRVLDISHSIERFDINEAAYVINLVRKDFPANTIHIIAIDTESLEGQRILCVKSQGQFFIVPDNGIISLIEPDGYYEVFEFKRQPDSSFIVRDVMAIQAIELIKQNYQPEKLFGKTDGINKKLAINPVVNNDTLQGTIVYVDSYGNAFTNITRTAFDDFVKSKKFRIILSHFEFVDKIHRKITDEAEGQTVCIFNENGYLMIRINQGKASQLYNLRKSKPIMIELL